MSLLGAFQDPQFRKDVARGLLDAGNRGAVGGLLGAPVDMVAMALRPLGYNVEQPVGGSEWIGQKMQSAGFVSPERNRLAEALASVAVPAAANRLAPSLFAAEQKAAQNLAAPNRMNAAAMGQAGMLRIPGRGQIPETAADVKKLSERFGKMLDQGGVEYGFSKSNLSPARYFEFDKPGTNGDELFKVRISDHRNVHGADYSVDPHTGATFEEMVSHVQGLGLPIASRVKPPPRDLPAKVFKAYAPLLEIGPNSLVAKASSKFKFGTEEWKNFYEPLAKEVYSIANMPKEQWTPQHLERLRQITEL